MTIFQKHYNVYDDTSLTSANHRARFIDIERDGLF